jgi:hypothetical protein
MIAMQNQLSGPRLVAPTITFVECTQCGYEPEDQVSMRPGRCPKCHGYSWHRLPVPGGLVGVADYHAGLKRHARQAAQASIRCAG